MGSQSIMVVAQEWEESERGWGVRPDGYTLHLTMNDCNEFRTEFWKHQKSIMGEEVPSEYTRESGEPFLVRVDNQTYGRLTEAKLLSEGKYGIWGEGRVARSIELAGETIVRTIFSEPLVVRACEAAEDGFCNKLRKAPAGAEQQRAPYMHHLHAVAGCLAEFGYLAAVVAAGYLHDHLEDLPEIWDLNRMQRDFGPEVAELVNWVTQQDKSLSWEVRNQRYEERLQLAPPEAIAISVADKISNLEDLLHWMRQGYAVETVLKRDWATNSEKLHHLAQLFATRVPQAMFTRFSDLLNEFDRLGNPDFR